MRILHRFKPYGFTLIELLIVVAIIAILAAIAVPNFLEAQTRSKVSRAHADMRTVDTATQAYRVDYNKLPRAQYRALKPGQYSNWWGFVSELLTTPVAYITSLPVDPFDDQNLLWAWEKLNPDENNFNNRPFLYIRHTHLVSNWTPGETVEIDGVTYANSEKVIEQAGRSGYILSSPGPDNRATAVVEGGAVEYDPTNGTVSKGDLYRFGAGEPDQRFYME